MDQALTAARPPNEVGIRDILVNTWELKWIILAILVLFTASGAITQALLVKKYKAEILLSPVTQSPTNSVGGGSMAGLASQYGALASLAGLSLNGQGASNKDESIATLQSELITESYIKDHNLLPVLFPLRWDASRNKWRTDGNRKPPTLWSANKYFKKVRDVRVDKVTGLVTLRISWTDPSVAATWANDLVKYTNQYLREKAISESEQNIVYLNQEAAKTNIVEAKAAIYSILRDEVNKQMVAKGREEYALKVIDPARAPESPSTPPMLFVASAALALGFVIAAILVVIKTSTSRSSLDDRIS